MRREKWAAVVSIFRVYARKMEGAAALFIEMKGEKV